MISKATRLASDLDKFPEFRDDNQSEAAELLRRQEYALEEALKMLKVCLPYTIALPEYYFDNSNLLDAIALIEGILE